MHQPLPDSAYVGCSLDELPQLWDGFAKLVREGLGITAFGAQIMDLPPNYTTKSHNESESGQQELYVALSGSGAVLVSGEHEEVLRLDPDHVAAVGPQIERTLSSGAAGLRVLCVGSTPGKPYEAPEWTTGR